MRLIYSIEIFQMVIEIPYSYQLNDLPSLQTTRTNMCSGISNVCVGVPRVSIDAFMALFRYRISSEMTKKKSKNIRVHAEKNNMAIDYTVNDSWRVTGHSRKFHFGLANAEGREQHWHWCGFMIYWFTNMWTAVQSAITVTLEYASNSLWIEIASRRGRLTRFTSSIFFFFLARSRYYSFTIFHKCVHAEFKC